MQAHSTTVTWTLVRRSQAAISVPCAQTKAARQRGRHTQRTTSNHTYPRGHQVVDDERALAGRRGGARHAELVAGDLAALLVLLEVLAARHCVGELALLSDHHERLLQRERDRGAQDEAAGVEAGDEVDVHVAVALHEDVDAELERLRVAEHAADVIESVNTYSTTALRVADGEGGGVEGATHRGTGSRG